MADGKVRKKKGGRRGRRRRGMIVAGAVLGIVALLPLARLGLRAPPEERAEHLRDLGALALRRGDVAEAETLLRRAIEAEPSTEGATALLAASLVAQDRTGEAVPLLEQRLEEDPRAAGVALELARVHANAGETERAEELAGRAAESSIHRAAALRTRAFSRLSRGAPRAAVEDFVALTQARTDDATACLRAASLLRLLGRATASQADLDRAAELVAEAERRAGLPGTPPVVLATALLERGLHASALDVLAREEPRTDIVLLRAEAAFRSGDVGRAETLLRRSLESATGGAVPGALVFALLRSGRPGGAAAVLAAATKRFPGDPALVSAALALARERARERLADDALVEAFVPRPNAPEPFEPALRAGLASEGLDADSLAVRIGLSAPDALLGAEGLSAAVADDIDQLLTQRPGDPVALAWRGALAARAGAWGEALAAADEALLNAPASARAGLVRSVALLRLERPADAVAAAHRALGLAVGNIRAPLIAVHARALASAQDADTALTALTRRAQLLDTPCVASVLLDLVRRTPRSEDAVDDATLARAEAVLLLAQGDVIGAARVVEGRIPGDAETRRDVLGAVWDLAAAHSEDRERRAPDDPAPSIARAQSLLRAGRPEQARLALESAARRQAAPGASVALARLLLSAGRGPEALTVLGEVAEAGRVDPDYRLVRARALLTAGRRGEASTVLVELLSGPAPDAVAVRAAILGLGLAPGRATVGVAVERWLSTRDDGDVDAAVVSAHLLLGRGRIADAESAAREALALKPGAAEAQVVLAACRALRGDLAGAEVACVEALARHEGHLPLRRLLARVLMAGSRRDVADGRLGSARARLERVVGLADRDSAAAGLIARSFLLEPDASQEAATYARLNEAHPASGAAPLAVGLIALERAQFSQAAIRCAEAFERAPQDPVNLAAAVRALIAGRRAESAESLCRRAIRGGFGGASAYRNLARALSARGDAAGALDALREGHDHDVADTALLGELVDALVVAGESESARARIEETRAAGGFDVVGSATQASLMERAGDVVGAIDVLRGDLGAPAGSAAQLALGRLLFRSGDWDGAVDALWAAVEANPARLEPYVLLVRAHVRRGSLDAAVDALGKRADGADGADPGIAHAMLALIAEYRDDLATAEAHYRKALDAHPKFVLAGNNLAWLLAVKRGRVEQALPLARAARDAAPRSADVADTLGWVLHLSGDSQGGLAEVDRAVRLRPRDAAFHDRRGRILVKLRRVGAAIEALEQVVACDPAYAEEHDVEKRIVGLRAILESASGSGR